MKESPEGPNLSRLLSHLEGSPFAFIEWDRDFRVRFWSPRAEQIFGWREDEVRGLGLGDWPGPFIHPGDFERIGALIEQITSGQVRQQRVRNRNFTKDGRVIHCEWHNSLLFDEHGQLSSAVSLVMDVTEQALADENLQSSEERVRRTEAKFRTLADAMPQLVWISSRDGQMSYLNRKWREYTGQDLDLATWSWRDHLHPEDFARVHAAFLECLRSGHPFHCELRLRRHDGTYRWHLAGSLPERDEAGQVTSWYGTCTDIHEMRIAQREALLFQRRLYQVIDMAPVIIWAVDKDGIFTLSEGSGLKMLGLDPGQAVGQSVFALYSDYPHVRKAIERALNGETFYEESEVAGRNYHVQYCPQWDSEGTVIGCSGVSIDVSETVNAARELSETKMVFRAAQELSPDGFVIIRPVRNNEGLIVDFEYRYANPRALRMIGYSEESIAGARMRDVLKENFLAGTPLFEALRDVADTGESRVIEVNFNSPSLRGWFRNTATRIGVDLAVHFTDITAHKEHQMRLAASEQKYRELFRNNPLPKWIYDTETLRILDVNDAALEHYGYARDEFLAMNVLDLRMSEPCTTSLTPVTGLSASAFEVEETFARHRTKSGAVVDVQLAYHDAYINDRPARLVVANDVTQIVRNETNLRLLAEAGTALNQSLDEDVLLKAMGNLCVPTLADCWIVDIIGGDTAHRRHVNAIEALAPLAQRLEATAPDMAQSAPFADVLRTRQPEINSRFGATVDRHEMDSDQMRILKEMNVQSYVVVPLIARNRILGTISYLFAKSSRRYRDEDLFIMQEIANRLALAIDNSRLYSEAQRASDAKTAFLANVSHEIRTPLGAIVGFTDVLLEESVSDLDLQRYLKIIKRNGRQLSLLINDLLDLSKIEAGRLDIETQKIALSHLISDVTSLFTVKANEKGVRFQVVYQEGALNNVHSDPLRLRQILTNIIGNAVKFTEKGQITIEVKAFQGPDDKTKAAILVHDTGIGIPVEFQRRLFQPFSQADNSMARRFGGTGLGLVLSRKLAQALGGSADLLHSVEGSGSTFMITFDPNLTTARTDRESRDLTQETLSSFAATPVNTRKILLVEDSPDNQILISRLLKSTGATVEFAVNGQEGLDRALSEEFDLILMDIQMPVMDGYEAVKRLRAAGYAKPIVALTAHAMRQERDHALNLGFDGYLTKPVDRQKLLDTVHNSFKAEVH